MKSKSKLLAQIAAMSGIMQYGIRGRNAGCPCYFTMRELANGTYVMNVSFNYVVSRKMIPANPAEGQICKNSGMILKALCRMS